MNNKIIKIIIFAVAILDCLLALVFAGRFNEDKKDNYIQVEQIKATNPTLLVDFEAATPENISSFLAKYQTELSSIADSLKKVQLQKDILYTYLQDLKGLTEENFNAYKSDFPSRSAALFAKCDNKQQYVDGFNNVADYAALDKYVSELTKEYDVMKQNYLVERDYVKSANSLLAQVDQINSSASVNKKTTELTTLQSDVKSFNTSASLQNVMIILAYILFFATLFMMLFFAFAKIITNFKTSYKVLLVLILFGVIFLIGYLIGTPELSTSAVKAGMSSSGYKLVNACTFSLYVSLLVAVVAVIFTAVYGAVKNRS